jgi:hypothetical protein
MLSKEVDLTVKKTEFVRTQEIDSSRVVRDVFAFKLSDLALYHQSRDSWFVGIEGGILADEWSREQNPIASVTGTDPEMLYIPEDEDDLEADEFAQSEVAKRAKRRRKKAVVSDYVFTFMGTLVSLNVNIGVMSAIVVSNSMQETHAALAKLREMFPEALPEPRQKQTKIAFWTDGTMGASQTTRIIDVPKWDEIKVNYGQNIREELSRMMGMSDGRAFSDGQLILWQGAPGTGKTYALRALAHSWVDWCDPYYIVDPERFFGNPNYMMQVILNETARSGAEKWKLLILEDAGELMSKTAKLETGQAFARLLNVVDGMIGQGLKLMVLITTNENLSDLHDAIQRPGRAAIQLKFDTLVESEVDEWAEAHNIDRSDLPYVGTLAELYEVKNVYRIKAGGNKKAMGFA